MKSLNHAKRFEKQQLQIKRRLTDGPKRSILLDEYISEPIMSIQSPSNVVLGAYSADEWATTSYMRAAIERGVNTLSVENTWLIPPKWDMHSFITGICSRYNFISHKRALLFWPWGVGECMMLNNRISFNLSGEPDAVKEMVQRVDTELEQAGTLIEWVYGEHGDSTNVPLNYRPVINAAYPWLPTDVNTYIDNYLNSDASVIILIGPPGTGKCLDPDEEIELLVSDEIYERLTTNK